MDWALGWEVGGNAVMVVVRRVRRAGTLKRCMALEDAEAFSSRNAMWRKFANKLSLEYMDED